MFYYGLLGGFREIIREELKPVTDIIVDLAVPEAQSTTSQRNHHQQKFKNELINYYQCGDPANMNKIKCMILNQFLNKSDVIASHIIPLEKASTLVLTGHSRTEKWSPRNGLLLYKPIDQAFENLQIVRILLRLYFLVNSVFVRHLSWTVIRISFL